MSRDEQDRVSYEHLMRCLNWKANPVPPPPSYQVGDDDPTKFLGRQRVKKAQERVCFVDGRALYNDIKPGCPVYKSDQQPNDAPSASGATGQSHPQ